jgi:hypothetical protein
VAGRFSYALLVNILPVQLQITFGIAIREKHNTTNRIVAVITLQLYNSSTNTSVVASGRSCFTTEQRKAANL